MGLQFAQAGGAPRLGHGRRLPCLPLRGPSRRPAPAWRRAVAEAGRRRSPGNGLASARGRLAPGAAGDRHDHGTAVGADRRRQPGRGPPRRILADDQRLRGTGRGPCAAARRHDSRQPGAVGSLAELAAGGPLAAGKQHRAVRADLRGRHPAFGRRGARLAARHRHASAGGLGLRVALHAPVEPSAACAQAGLAGRRSPRRRLGRR